METTTLTQGQEVTTSPLSHSWTLDKAHAKLGFNVTHLLVSEVHGSFKAFEATINSKGEGFENAFVELTADINSVDTDQKDRDNHLKNADFFDAAQYPNLNFKSSSIKKVDDNKYKMTGELTFHGVTKPVELDVIAAVATHPFNHKTIAGFKVSGAIKRTDFNLGNSIPSMVVSDKVEISANAEFIQE